MRKKKWLINSKDFFLKTTLPWQTILPYKYVQLTPMFLEY